MKREELIDLFKNKIDREYYHYINSLYSRDKSDLLLPNCVEKTYYMQVFHTLSDDIDPSLKVEYIIDIENLLNKTVTMFLFDCIADERSDYRNTFNHFIGYERSQLKKKIKESTLTLAEKLDYFYAENNPYDRYDSVGSFSPEYDDDNEGLKQIKECLNSPEGKENLREYLYDIICGESNEDVKDRARMLLIEIDEYVCQSQKQEVEQE